MRKSLFLVLLSCFVFGQNRKIDSLKMIVKKKPNDFNLQINYLGELLVLDDKNLFAIELQSAQNKFRDNKDYKFFFKIYEVLALLKKQKNLEANDKLDSYNKTLDLKSFPQSNILYNYLKATIEARLGNHNIAEKYYLETFRLIKESKINNARYVDIYNSYASSLIKLGKYEEALKILFEALKLKKYDNLSVIYTNIGICYFHLKQMSKAEYYYLLAIKNSNEADETNNITNLAILFLESGNYKKAQEIMLKINLKKLSVTDSASVFSALAEIEKQKENYPKAIEYFKIVEKIDLKTDQNSYLINDYLAIGNLYKESNYIRKAESYFKKSYQLLKKYKDENAKMEVLQNLLEISFLKNKDSIREKYFKEFLELTDSINSKTVQESTNELNLKYQTELKETQIKSQQLELEKEKTNRNIAISGIGFLLLLSGGGFWFFKNRQKQKELQNQNTLLGLQQNLNAMELQSLNKQLDPHEIKNLLASISPEIQEKAPESYRKMLKLFNITKASLNSHSLTESIENQIQQTEDFLSLEKSMLPEPLEYSIENKIEQKDQQIPRLMLKNLVENAVKHGIKGKENGGTIKIELFEKNDFIYITVDDTGRGRKQAISSDSGIGTSTYQKLFATLNNKNKDNATFEITDKEQGTKVEVRIPKDYKYN